MKTILRLALAVSILLPATSSFAWGGNNGNWGPFGNNGWGNNYNPYDEWDPRYWMEEMENTFDDNGNYGGPGAYGNAGPGRYGPPPGYYGSGPYGPPPGYAPNYAPRSYGPPPGYRPNNAPRPYGPPPGYAPNNAPRPYGPPPGYMPNNGPRPNGPPPGYAPREPEAQQPPSR